MTTYDKLKKEFEKKVKELQDNCKHKVSKWYEKVWAPGHYSGYKVKVCSRCNKEIEEKPTKDERMKKGLLGLGDEE